MKLTAAVIDDEPLARARLTRLLSEVGVKVAAEGTTGLEALEIVSANDIDLLFLDINMPKLNGIEAAKTINLSQKQPPAIIYCTAYDDYAIEAFSTQASSYILKPFSKEDIQSAIQHAISLNKAQALNFQDKSTHFLLASGNNAMQKIALEEILYIEAINKYVYATLENDTQTLVHSTLKEIEANHNDDFFRVNRSTLISINRIRSLEVKDGEYRIKVQGSDIEFSVSRRKISEAKKHIKSI